MSKGRPHCLTASTLVKIGFPGEWFIVCGDNDEALLEYVERWGENRVMVFDWKKHAEGCDLMDCGPLAPSGAAPARNAIGEIAARRGEVRHWQFDDDYEGFTVFNGERFVKASGGELEKLLGAYEEFGLGTGAYAVGFAVATGFLRPDGVGNVRRNVTNCFNFRTRPWVPWTSRVFDDVTTPLRAHRAGEIEFCVPLAGALRKDSKKQTGGAVRPVRLRGAVRAHDACRRVLADWRDGARRGQRSAHHQEMERRDGESPSREVV